MQHTHHQNEEVIRFEQHVDTQSSLFQAALDIYTHAFPARERHPEKLIRERVAKGENQLYIGLIQHTVVFIALLWPLKNSAFILLDYMATDPAHQGKKIASGFLAYMKPALRRSNKYFVLEVEDPELGNNKPTREKRIAFYRANGAYRLAGVRYILPALQGNETTDMILMLFPQYPGNNILASTVQEIITRLYKELYNRPEKEALKNSSGYTEKTMITLN